MSIPKNVAYGTTVLEQLDAIHQRAYFFKVYPNLPKFLIDDVIPEVVLIFGS